MANKRNVEIDLIVDDSQKSKLKGIGDTAGQTQGKFSQLSGGLKAAALGMAAVVGTKIISFLGDAAQAAADDQKAQELLALAIQNSTDATDADIDKTEAWIKKVSLAAGVADDELRPALAELVRTTGDLETAQDTMGVAMDIAAAKGIPLETVTKAIGKAALGNVGALGRLGVATKDADGATMTFEETLAEANRTMGGATAVAAETAEGKMRRFQVAVDEAKESVGGLVVGVLADLAEQGSDIAQVMGFLSEKIGGLIPEAGGLGTELKEWIGPLAMSGQLFDFLADKIDEVTAAAEPNARAITTSWGGYDQLTRSVDDATRALQDNAGELRAQMDPMFNLIDKTNDLAEAQTKSGEARDKYGDGSPEHLEALRKEAEAFLNLKEAQIKAAEESGITRDQFRTNLETMRIFTRGEIDLMVAEFDRLDGRVIDTTINVNLAGRGASTFSDTLVGFKAAGGPVRAGGAYVVGEQGPELLQMGSQNGNVVPNSALGGGSINVYVAGSVTTEKELVEVIRAQFIRDNRSGRAWS